ncbi:MAG: hypothetical protein HDR33_03850 [Treponema sp.]|nr:hypothetical protein [Treponema sp.]MBD5440139.1 hypothetical protein [Treponema sp.]
MVETEFENIDINSFFDLAKIEDEADAEIVVFTARQRKMLDIVLPHLKVSAPQRYESFSARLKHLTELAKTIAHFPSLLERQRLVGGERTPTSLIDSLLKHQNEGDATLHLPSKASLGRSFLVTKIHTFATLSNIAKNIGEPEDTVQDLKNEAVKMMFSLLAEDVYLNCVCDKTMETDLRREMAMSLLLLWEHRSDEAIDQIAPVLQNVWIARRQLAPAFGTMIGTSELLLISMQMDESWAHFIKERLGDEMVSHAMEEFIFGISTEQITKLRSILREQGIKAIGRDEVSEFLGVYVKADAGLDYRDFYSMYTVRRDNARARARLGIPGPQKTLEDYFIQFVLQSNREKQKRDIFAK